MTIGRWRGRSACAGTDSLRGRFGKDFQISQIGKLERKADWRLKAAKHQGTLKAIKTRGGRLEHFETRAADVVERTQVDEDAAVPCLNSFRERSGDLVRTALSEPAADRKDDAAVQIRCFLDTQEPNSVPGALQR